MRTSLFGDLYYLLRKGVILMGSGKSQWWYLFINVCWTVVNLKELFTETVIKRVSIKALVLIILIPLFATWRCMQSS